MNSIDKTQRATMSREGSQDANGGSVTTTASTSTRSNGAELEKALSKLSVSQQRAEMGGDDDVRIHPSMSDASGSEAPPASKNVEAERSTLQPAVIDPVLVEAMRVPRDKAFVVHHERDIEDRIKDASTQGWDLPLMNSYHRLLIHRIADHFRLSHTIDPVSKQVTLTKTDDTRLPPIAITTLAENERLSEPLTGQSTPSSTAGMLAGGVRIMRRPDGTPRSDSPRNGTSTPDGARKDRRNMTIEEREAAYSEARQRIFGSEGNGESSAVVAADREPAAQSVGETSIGSSSGNFRRDDRKASSSGARSITPSVSSTSDSGAGSAMRTAVTGALEEDRFSPASETIIGTHFDPSAAGMLRQAVPNPYAYPSPMDQQQAAAHYNQGGGYPTGPVQFDGQGRPMMMMIMTGGQQWPFAPYPYPNGQAIHYGYNTPPVASDTVQSPDASSRSTSLSAGTESVESARSSFSEQTSQQPYQALTSPSSNAASHQGTPINRSQSVSPTTTYPHQSGHGPQSFLPQGHGVPFMYMHPTAAQGYAPAQSYTPPSPMDFSGAMRGGLMRPINGNGQLSGKAASTPPLPTHLSQGDPRYGPGYGRAPLNGPIGSHSVITGPEYPTSPGPTSGAFSRGRGRSSQGSERSLFDPNKPSLTAAASSQGSSAGGRHSLGKSSSAAAVLENGLSPTSHSRTDGLPMTSTTPPTLTGIRSSAAATSALGSRHGSSAAPPSVRGGYTPSSFTAPVHPSLPARPDWAVAARQASFAQSNSSSSSMSKSGSIGDTQAQACPVGSAEQPKPAENCKATPSPKQDDVAGDSASHASASVESRIS